MNITYRAWESVLGPTHQTTNSYAIPKPLKNVSEVCSPHKNNQYGVNIRSNIL